MKALYYFSMPLKLRSLALLILFNLVFISQNAVAQLIPQQPFPVLGERSVLWIRGQDPISDPMKGTEQDILDAQVEFDKYIRRVSYGKASIKKFDITPVYNFNAADGSYQIQLDEAANQGGYNVNDYNIIYYHFKGNVTIGGGATGSGNGNRGSVNLPDAVVEGRQFDGVIHEGIHALGLGHSEGLEGKEGIFPGKNLGGSDPYHFMGSQGDAGLRADLPSYFKYSLGWIDPSSIELQPLNSDDCKTFKIYESSDIDSPVDGRKYALQYGPEFWVTYVPTSYNSRVVKTGLLMYWQPKVSPDVNRLLDLNPETLKTERANDVQINVADFWDAALGAGDQRELNGDSIVVIAEGGDVGERWVEFQICSCVAKTGDSDNDGVCDSLDQCEGQDDRIDADLDGIPDTCDSCPNDNKNDANNNSICDNLECTIASKDDFNYNISETIANAEDLGDISNSNWANSWKLNSNIRLADGPTTSIVEGSLDYPSIDAVGNHILIKHSNRNQFSIWERGLDITLNTGDTFWVSYLLKSNKEDPTGKMLVMPGDARDNDLGLGKVERSRRSGRNPGISVDGFDGTPLAFEINKTYWIVGKYTLNKATTTVDFWVDPTKANFDETTPNGSFVSNTALSSVDKITIFHSLGENNNSEYELDALEVGCYIPTNLNDCTLSGTTCDDNNVCTINDTYDDNCNCYGTFADTDKDGICNGEDTEEQSCVLGAPCDDNNECTTNDSIDVNCECVGKLNDANNDDVCDLLACDTDVYEGFEYATDSSIVGANGGFGFSDGWELLTNQGDVDIIGKSLTYEGFKSKGGKLRFEHIFGSDIELRRNFDKDLFQDGNEFWSSWLFKAVDMRIGHVRLKPNNNQDIGTNKRRGFIFGIDRETDFKGKIENDVTYWVVAQYVKGTNGLMTIKMWINPTINSFDLSAPNVIKEARSENSVNFFTLLVERPESENNVRGVYEVDEIRFSCKIPSPLKLDNVDCTAGNSVVPLYTINTKEFLGGNVIEVEEGLSFSLKGKGKQELSGAEDKNTYTVKNEKGESFDNLLKIDAVSKTDAGIYTITNQLGCETNFKLKVVDAVTGTTLSVNGPTINESNSLVRIYPNPASEVVHINLPTEKEFDATIYDMSGAIVMSSKNNKTMNTSTLVSGTYFIKIDVSSSKEVYYRKLIIF